MLKQRYQKELRWQLGNPEREDPTLKLWIDLIEEDERAGKSRKCYNAYNSYTEEDRMKNARSMVLSMRLPVESGKRLKRIANRHGWTASDASARLVEEGLRRSEFAFLDFRDSPAGRQAYIQGSTLAIWEVMLLIRSYKGNVKDVAKHLNWPETKVRAALNYSEAFPEEVNEAIAENDSTDFDRLKRMLPQAVEFAARRIKRG